jgi:hypothetical protein
MCVIMRCFVCMCLFTVSLVSQAHKAKPKFHDYPVSEIYKGKPAPPILTSKRQRMFRTMIRLGAKQPVKFAGHYTLPNWGCGASCMSFAIVDSRSGKVYDTPFDYILDPVGGAWLDQFDDKFPERIEFHPNSRLLRIFACPDGEDCGFHYYLMVDSEGLRLLRREPLPK